MELSNLLEKSLEGFDCQKRKMFGCPAYFVNNNMFTGAHQDNIILRLSDKDRLQLSNIYDEAERFEPMEGRVMKEYMIIPEIVYSDANEFNTWLVRSYEYTSKLPPKVKKNKRKKEKK
jgi:TfoX/Sxy family transcriptional regulator of competence genes